MSLRSARSSSSTTSSLDSTFSDISRHASSSSSSSPPNAKTNAFFASPFSTRPPSPSPPASPPPTDKQPSKPRSLTADFFATPVRAPSPPASSAAPPPSVQTIDASRIFPSRYTSSLSERRTPEFSLLDLEADPFHAQAHRSHTHTRNLSSSSSESSSASFTASFPRARLPTPPPSPLHREYTIMPTRTPPQQPSASTSSVRLDDLVDDEPTPRPADREPPVPMLRFERSLLLQRQAEASAEPAPPVDDEESDTELESPEDYEPRAGNIIALPAASQLPLSPLAFTFSIPGSSSRRSSMTDLRDPSGDDQDAPTPKNEESTPGSFATLSPSSSLTSSPASLHPPPLLSSSSDDAHVHPTSNSTSSSAVSTSRGLPSPTASVSSTSHDGPSSADLLPQHHLQQHPHLQPQSQQTYHPRVRKPQLRLLRSLGHGAFSAVWLAEDLSQVPLTLVSRRSIRDLRRMASGREKERERGLGLGGGGGRAAQGGGGVGNASEGSRAGGEREQRDRERGEGNVGQRSKNAERVWSEFRSGVVGVGSSAAHNAAPPPPPAVALISIPIPAPAPTPIPETSPVAKSPRPTSKLRGLRNMLSFSRSPNPNATGSSPSPSALSTVPSSNANMNVNGNAVVLPLSPVSPADAAAPSSASLSMLQPSISRTSSTSSSSSAARLKWNLPLHPHSHPHLYAHSHSQHLNSNGVPYIDAEHGGLPNSHAATNMNTNADSDMDTETDTASALLARDASLRKFRARVRGTRPPASLGRVYLDERDGEMGTPTTAAQSVSVVGAGRGAHSGGGRAGGGAGAGVDVDAGAEEVGLGASLSRNTSLSLSLHRTPSSASSLSSSFSTHGRLVAVKMTPRRPPRARGHVPVSRDRVTGAGADAADAYGQAQRRRGGGGGYARERLRERQHRKEEEERTRVGFVREVEVLKHISHPNITPLLAHLSSATHHILVLPYLPGGDLLGLVNDDVAWGKLSEAVLRRIWCELCKAVGWMHGVGLVHRDIKLENILLTAPTFSSLTAQSLVPTLEALPPPPLPFIKISDFGLSRFVEIDANGDAELLSTRCGSEAYAAPELVTGGSGPSGRGVYDARKTDAWACGVVLYALVGRQLPFGEGVAPAHGGIGAGDGSKIGGERGLGRGAGPGTPQERRHWLMRIARGEWEWPGVGEDDDGAAANQSPTLGMSVDEDELVGAQLVKCRGAQRIVTRLLVRDPKKRARIADLWDDQWMTGGSDSRGSTAVSLRDGDERRQDAAAPAMQDVTASAPEMAGDEKMHWDSGNESQFFDTEGLNLPVYDESAGIKSSDFDGHILDNEEEEDDDEVDTDGCLFDQEGIDSITRREVV